MKTSLLLATLLASSSTAYAELQITAEAATDSGSFAAASLDQQLPSIAYGDGEYFAVWRDGNDQVGQVWTIRGVRLKPDCTFIDTAPIALRNASENLSRPAVAFDGTRFLVVWERVGELGDPDGNDIVGVYVDPSTAAVTAPFTVGGGLYSQTQPAVAGGDGVAMVTWNEFNTIYLPTDNPQGVQTVWGVVLPEGQAAQPAFQLSAYGEIGVYSSLAWSTAAQTFGVAWFDSAFNGEIWATQVDGQSVESTPFQLTDGNGLANDLSLGVLGSTFVVGWDAADYPFGQPTSIYARAFPASGPPTTPQFLLAQGTGAGDYHPQILGVDSQLVGLWESQAAGALVVDLFGGRFLANGTRSDGDGVLAVDQPSIAPGALPNSSDSYRSVVASAGSTGLVAYGRVGAGASRQDVLVSPIDPSAASWAPQTPTVLAREPSSEKTWSIGSNGTSFLVVWEDNRLDNGSDGGLDVYGLRYGLDGAPLDAAPFLISTDETIPTNAAPGDQYAPAVAGLPGGGDYLVVWSDARGVDFGSGYDLYGARIATTGTPTQVTQHISTGLDAQLQPSLAASSDGWLVAWEDFSPSVAASSHLSSIFTTFVAESATTTPYESFQLTLATPLARTACQASVAWNGTHFFVAYENPCAEDYAQPQADVGGHWVDVDGTPLGGAVTIANKSFNETAPAVAADGGRLFAVWREQGAQNGILATTFADLATTAEGTTSTLFAAAGVREAPAATAVGGVLLVDWIDDEPAEVAALRFVADQGLEPLDTTPVVFHEGAVFQGLDTLSDPPDSDGLQLSYANRYTPKPALASAPTGETLVAYNTVTSSVSRIDVRKLGLAGNGTSCTSAGACADGICTNGTCCDVTCDGVCQQCSAKGCVTTPPNDSRCPTTDTTSCATLSTSCRTYAEGSTPAGECVAFGECATAVSAGVCTSFTDVADGTTCEAAGCTAGASCTGGTCVCSTEQNMLEPARNVGCDAAPGRRASVPAVLLVCTALGMLLRRRRSAS